MSREPSSPPVAWGGDPDLNALLFEAIERVASPKARAALMSRALVMAGRTALPAEIPLLLAFVDGPLQSVATHTLGEQAANALVSDVRPLLERVQRIRASTPVPGSMSPPASASPPESTPPPAQELRARSAVRDEPQEPPRRRTLPPEQLFRKASPVASRAIGATLPYLSREVERGYVLLVDDDAAFLSGLGRLLRAAGHDVISAPEGASALRICESVRPALVLTDLDMPPPNGLELATLLVERMGDRTPPIVLLTGAAVLPKDPRGVALVLSKTIRPSELLAAIEPYLIAPAPKS